MVAQVGSIPRSTQAVSNLTTAKRWYIDVPLSTDLGVRGGVCHADCSVQAANNSSNDDSFHDALIALEFQMVICFALRSRELKL